MAVNKKTSQSGNKPGAERAGKVSQGGKGVPDETKKNSTDNDLDSHGNERGSGDRISGPEQDNGGLGGGSDTDVD